MIPTIAPLPPDVKPTLNQTSTKPSEDQPKRTPAGGVSPVVVAPLLLAHLARYAHIRDHSLIHALILAVLLHLRRPQRDVLTFLDPDGAGCEPCDLVTLLVPESYDRFPDRVAMVVVPVNDAVVDHPHLPFKLSPTLAA